MKKSEQGSLILSALEIQGPLINAIPQINLYKLNNRLLSSIVNKSVFAPSASPSHSLSKFPQHEVTRSITTTPWMGCWSSTHTHTHTHTPPPTPPAFHQAFLTVSQHPFILLVGERHCERKVSFPIIQHIDPARYPNQTSQPRVQYTETASPTVNGYFSKPTRTLWT